MTARFWKFFSLALIAAALATPQLIQATAPDAAKRTKARLAESFGKIPLHFEANRGQMDPEVKFLSRGRGYTLFLTPEGAVLSLRKTVGKKPSKFERGGPQNTAPKVQTSVIRMKLLGANKNPKITGREKLSGVTNYFTGKDSKKWRRNIPNYRKVEYKKIYPGVNLVYYGNQRKLEYDFVVAPGADYKKIGFSLSGAEKIAIDEKGNLILSTKSGRLIQKAPYTYQMVNGARKEIKSRYVLDGNKVAFEVASYDETKTLVIDPVLEYSTYIGGFDFDRLYGLALDPWGNLYVVGKTPSADFPMANALQPIYPTNTFLVFVTKINEDGSAFVYSTFLGQGGGSGVAVDAHGYAYVTGTARGDFPTTANAFQSSRNGSNDAFVTKLTPNGDSLVYSTYLGGTDRDYGYRIAVDADGNAHVTGYTFSGDFPVTPSAVQTVNTGSALPGLPFSSRN